MIGNITPSDYSSNPIEIPPNFLKTPPSKPVTSNPIDFTAARFPSYAKCKAVLIDNVISSEECAELLALTEASVPLRKDAAPSSTSSSSSCSSSSSAWRPALVSLGPGIERLAPGYRESDRIIWDQQDVVNRLWERCRLADGVEAMLQDVPDPTNGKEPGRWEFRRFNARQRYLKYSPGQYFKPHCDGPYWYEDGDREFMTHYTVQLYLNDSKKHNPESDLVGGATAFLSRGRDERLDVDPKAGTVLIFQHRSLLHEGAEVKGGTKYTMRTDVIYEWIPEKAES